MRSTDSKTLDAARLNFRLPSEIKKRVENAALVSGITVTDFAISALERSANQVLSQHEVRKLSTRDRDMFLAMLDDPPEPNEALRKAVKRWNTRAKK